MNDGWWVWWDERAGETDEKARDENGFNGWSVGWVGLVGSVIGQIHCSNILHEQTQIVGGGGWCGGAGLSDSEAEQEKKAQKKFMLLLLHVGEILPHLCKKAHPSAVFLFAIYCYNNKQQRRSNSYSKIMHN